MRGLVALIICIGLSTASGCTPGRGFVALHPHSEVTSPTFCLHTGAPHEPIPIRWLKVSTYHEERWETLWELVFAAEGAPEPKPRNPTLSELVQPPTEAVIPARPFSCITYGRVPPGYKETTPAAPLIPDTWYAARVDYRAEHVYPADLRFFIISDSSGRPIKLEYRYLGSDKRVHVITNLTTTEVRK